VCGGGGVGGVNVRVWKGGWMVPCQQKVTRSTQASAGGSVGGCEDVGGDGVYDLRVELTKPFEANSTKDDGVYDLRRYLRIADRSVDYGMQTRALTGTICFLGHVLQFKCPKKAKVSWLREKV
jgi:hypothetical protein